MQATHYRKEEEEGSKRALPIKGSTLGSDNAFAEFALSEQKPLMGGEKVWYNLLRETKEKWWLSFTWTLEVLLILYVCMAMSMEIWGACPHEMGIAPVCQYCYSTAFLIWDVVLVCVWFLDLYLFILLVSRGFTCTFARFSQLFPDNEARGIPAPAISTFLYLTTVLVAWLLLGIFLLVLSQSCNKSDGSIFAASSPGRSGLMVTTTCLCIFAAPILLVTGRRIGAGPYWLPDISNIGIPEVNVGFDL